VSGARKSLFSGLSGSFFRAGLVSGSRTDSEPAALLDRNCRPTRREHDNTAPFADRLIAETHARDRVSAEAICCG